jgi:hypothetical protein
MRTRSPAFADLLAEQVLWQARAATRRQAPRERGISWLFFRQLKELVVVFQRSLKNQSLDEMGLVWK